MQRTAMEVSPAMSKLLADIGIAESELVAIAEIAARRLLREALKSDNPEQWRPLLVLAARLLGKAQNSTNKADWSSKP